MKDGGLPHPWVTLPSETRLSQSPFWFFLVWTVFVLDCSRLTYPVDGYLPLQDPPTTDLLKAHKLLGFIKNVLSIAIDTQVTADGTRFNHVLRHPSCFV